jgi:hypothetical protein
MAAAATARRAPATARPAPRRKPRPRQRPRPAPAGRMMRPAVAGAALFPQAAVRGVGAVRDISDSSLIMRLTRGRGWIAVLCALLGGIVALNVISLSLNAGAGRLSLQIDELKTQVSALNAQIDERLSASRVEAEATRLGLAVPDPKSITYLSASDGSAERLAHLLGTDSFLLAPSLPSSYPTDGQSYSPVGTSATPTSTSSSTITTTASPSQATGPTASSGTGSASGASAGTGTSSGSTGGSTGGVGL